MGNGVSTGFNFRLAPGFDTFPKSRDRGRDLTRVHRASRNNISVPFQFSACYFFLLPRTITHLAVRIFLSLGKLLLFP